MEKMMRKFLSAVCLVIVLTLAACGPKSEPTSSVADIQNTALAVALTNIIMTQSAVPTNTAIPPTPIPVTAIPTLEVLPTSALETPIVAPPANSNASSTPDCYQPPPAELLGTTVNVRFVNEAGGPVDLSMGMYAPNDRGECFTFAFFIGRNLSEDVTVLAGCYWIAGYQNGPEPSTPRVNYICLDAISGRHLLQINPNTIGYPE
jgi:hypothetical protein